MLYRKAVKLLLLLFLMWITGFITVVQEYNIPLKYFFVTRDVKTEATVISSYSNYSVNTPQYRPRDNRAWQIVGPDQSDNVYNDLSTTIVGSDIPPGKLGRPVVLKKNLKGSVRALVKMGWDDHAFNKFVSDIIPLNRSLLDPRDKWCLGENRFLKELPQASVVICFYNEALSTLLRTVHSVINRSPEHLLREIILVDDFSSVAELKRKLEERIKTLPKVRLIRASRREGLVRSRLIGAKEATAPVVIFLDSHCECTEGWMVPLLDSIARNYTNVASPVVDVIDETTFQYQTQASLDLQIGGFTWSLNYIWRFMPAKAMRGRVSTSAPAKTPIISGGLFAISKQFFKELGYYDDGLEIWGGDNFDISFKVWMCGGSLEIVPCSHVGHVFRKYIPYYIPSMFHVRNNMVRIAEVWLNDTAKYFYERIGSMKPDVGDISIQKAHRAKCKPFSWYLENIYPELELPKNNVAGGEIANMAHHATTCLDSAARHYDVLENIRLLPCHHEGYNQYWDYTKHGQLKRDNFCLNVLANRVILSQCWDLSLPDVLHRDPVWMDMDQIAARANQIWVHEPKAGQIKHLATQKCLEAKTTSAGLIVQLASCMPSYKSQKWTMERYNASNASPELRRAMLLSS